MSMLSSDMLPWLRSIISRDVYYKSYYGLDHTIPSMGKAGLGPSSSALVQMG